MPIFARRRLGKMLDDLARHLDGAKTSDLQTRLEHRDTQNALSAEAELAMLWAIFQVADLEVEPQIEGSSKRPDAYSKTLFSSAPAIIEITGPSDDTFSGKDIMDRAANKMVSFADQVRKRAGRHLHFEFLEKSYWKDHRFHRERCVKRDFKLTPHIEHTLREWIFRSNPPEPQTIRITDNAIDVVVSWHVKEVLPTNRTFCRMPAVAYDLEDNPIYKALREKRKQLTKVRSDTLRKAYPSGSGTAHIW